MIRFAYPMAAFVFGAVACGTTAGVMAGAPAALPAGKAAAGEEVFKKCAACHKVGPMATNGVGPNLNGIVGRKAGSVAGYNYSDANKNSGLTWTEAQLASYLPAPSKAMPGTKMTFVGLPMPQDVADIIAYLAQFDAMGNKK